MIWKTHSLLFSLTGLPSSVPCTAVNKVCASGMKSIMQAAQSLSLGHNNVMVAGGMENMSLSRHCMPMRAGVKFGDVSMEDTMIKVTLAHLSKVISSLPITNKSELTQNHFNHI